MHSFINQIQGEDELFSTFPHVMKFYMGEKPVLLQPSFSVKCLKMFPLVIYSK